MSNLQITGTITKITDVQEGTAKSSGKYSPRPGTAAFQMKDDVSIKEKKRREKTLKNMLNPAKRSNKL